MAIDHAHRGMFDLDGKIALVTGGLGILGSVYVDGLAKYGADVVVADMDGEACRARAAELSAQYGVRAFGIDADVSSPDSVEAMVQAIDAEFGAAPEIALNNAASKGDDLAAFFAPTEEYDLDTWRKIMAVNLDGVFLVAQAVGRRMIEAGRGSIINVSSIYGNVGPDQRIYEGSEYLGRAINTPAIYAASKAGVLGLTRYLATLWADKNVRVNTLTPGGVESGQNAEFLSRYAARTPLGRMARNDEMLGAVIYLASDASSYVTGHNLVVDGGWSIW